MGMITRMRSIPDNQQFPQQTMHADCIPSRRKCGVAASAATLCLATQHALLQGWATAIFTVEMAHHALVDPKQAHILSVRSSLQDTISVPLALNATPHTVELCPSPGPAPQGANPQ